MSHKEAEDQGDHPSDLEKSIRSKKDHAAKCIHIPNLHLPSPEPSAAQQKPGFCSIRERLSQSYLPKNLLKQGAQRRRTVMALNTARSSRTLRNLMPSLFQNSFCRDNASGSPKAQDPWLNSTKWQNVASPLTSNLCSASLVWDWKGSALSWSIPLKYGLLGNSLELEQSILWSRSQAAMSKRIAQELSMEEPGKYEDAESG